MYGAYILNNANNTDLTSDILRKITTNIFKEKQNLLKISTMTKKKDLKNRGQLFECKMRV